MPRDPRPVSRRALLAAVPLLTAAAALVGCESYKDAVAARRRYAARGQGDVVIGAVEQRYNPSGFADGMRMAAAEVNQAGGLLGRRISLLVTDDGGGLDGAERNARALARDPSLFAVISCESSATAIATSVTYQFNDVLCMEVSSTNPRLTAHPFDLIFRTIPNDIYNSKAIAAYMVGQGYKKTVVINDRSTYGHGLSSMINRALYEQGGTVAAQRTYLPDPNTFWKDLDEIKGQDFDSVFLVGYPHGAAEFIKVLRTIGITAPIVGGDSLDSPVVWKVAGAAANGLVVPTVFHRDIRDPRVEQFVQGFSSRYGVAPDTRAAKGYEALKLLATVVAAVNLTDPKAIAAVMRYRKGWQGPFSDISFDNHGDVVGRKIYFQRLENEEFTLVKE